MKRTYFVCLFLCLSTFLFSQSNPVPASISTSQADSKAQARILASYGQLPLAFEANHGQTDAHVKFLSHTGGYTLFLTGDEAVLALNGKKASTDKAKIARVAHTLPSSVAAPKAGGVLQMKLRHANPAAKVTGVNELAGTSNYFIGNDPAKWRTDVPTYAKVKYEGIYSGIDLVYYGNQRQLEYDFIVSPGANPHRIQFDVRGAKRIRQNENGELVFEVGKDEIRWHKPLVYQERNGTRQKIAARYALKDENRVGFVVAKYDSGRPLYIDPLIYSTYLGGSGWDVGYGIAVDSSGNAYVTGYTASTDFPVTPGAFQTTCNGGSDCGANEDAFVTKFNPSGSALVYSTYLGGSGSERGYGIAVDSSGNAYVTGYTTSTDFPVTPSAFQTTGGGAFVTKFNPSGALVYSTYLGSIGDGGYGVAVDSSGDAYVTGVTASTNFPTTPGAFQTTFSGVSDAFVTKVNPSGSALAYSTYLGGSGQDGGFGIAVDISGNAYVTGGTSSTDFPMMNPLQPNFAGGSGIYPLYGDAFVTKISVTGSALIYSTYLGGSENDGGYGIAVDSSGNAYVTGYTASTDFPVTPGAFQGTYDGDGDDVFVTELNPSGSALAYSTYLGGSSYGGRGIAVDISGNAYVTGQFGYDPFVYKLNPTGTALVYSTYLSGHQMGWAYGIAVDSAGYPYVTGAAQSGFPVTQGAFQKAFRGSSGKTDAFVAKIDPRWAPTITLSSSPNPSAYGEAVTFTAVIDPAPPNGETISYMKGTTVLGTGTLSGGTANFTTSTLTVSTNFSIKAMYAGDSNFVASTSKTLKQVVNKATTTTTLASSQDPSSFGQSVTFTATVTPEYSGTVTGNVKFYDGTTLLKSEALTGGAAKYTTSKLVSGAHTITAKYGGSADFTTSTSAPLTQTVD